jgi:hypothetical protein
MHCLPVLSNASVMGSLSRSRFLVPQNATGLTRGLEDIMRRYMEYDLGKAGVTGDTRIEVSVHVMTPHGSKPYNTFIQHLERRVSALAYRAHALRFAAATSCTNIASVKHIRYVYDMSMLYLHIDPYNNHNQHVVTHHKQLREPLP